MELRAPRTDPSVDETAISMRMGRGLERELSELICPADILLVDEIDKSFRFLATAYESGLSKAFSALAHRLT
jgi:hypothetical protein